MRAGVYRAADKSIVIQDIEMPKADHEKSVIRVEAAGICGSDLTAYKNASKPDGIIFGHEYAGTVEEPGSNTDIKKGDRVVVYPTNHCGECPECMRGLQHDCLRNVAGGFAQGLGLVYPGAYAEYAAAFSKYLIKIPESTPFEEAAMTEPVAVSLRAVHQARVFAGSRVVVTGAGFIAITAAILARLQGASFIAVSARTPEKAQELLKRGIVDVVLDAKAPDHADQLKAACGNRGYDVALECTGHADIQFLCVQVMRPAGRICLVGLTPSSPHERMMTLVAVKELELIGTMGYTMEEYYAAIELIDKKLIDVAPYITKRISLDELEPTFKDLTGRKTQDIKVVLKPWG